MEYFDISVEGKTYVVRPSYDDSAMLLTTEVNGSEIVFKGSGDGLRVIDAGNIDRELIDKLASEIEAYLM